MAKDEREAARSASGRMWQVTRNVLLFIAGVWIVMLLVAKIAPK